MACPPFLHSSVVLLIFVSPENKGECGTRLHSPCLVVFVCRFEVLCDCINRLFRPCLGSRHSRRSRLQRLKYGFGQSGLLDQAVNAIHFVSVIVCTAYTNQFFPDRYDTALVKILGHIGSAIFLEGVVCP